jgi:hypothetical protein
LPLGAQPVAWWVAIVLASLIWPPVGKR